jgi:hypothetical protein
MKTILVMIALLMAQVTFAANPFLTSETLSSQQLQRSEVFATQIANPDFKFALPPNSDKCHSYQKMKKTGLILFCVGAPVALTGVTCLIVGNAIAINEGDLNSVPLIAAGAVLFVGGLGMTGAGVPLYIIGKIKSKKYCGGTSFQLQESKSGLGVAYNF